MRAVHKPPPKIHPPRPLGEGIGVRVITMTKKQINASDRASHSPLRKLLYRRFLLNQSNASIRRTTGTQTPDPILPVPTMLKPYNRNPLTIHIASHTGSEVRGEGNLMRHPSASTIRPIYVSGPLQAEPHLPQPTLLQPPVSLPMRIHHRRRRREGFGTLVCRSL